MLSWFVTGSLLILAVMLLRRVFRGRASARAIYALWLFAAMRLLIPGSVAVEAPSVAAAVERAPVVQMYERMEGAESIERRPTGEVEIQYADAERAPELLAGQASEREFDLMALLLTLKKLTTPLWLAGAGVVALTFLASYLRFSRELRRDRAALEVAAPLAVYVSGAVDTPCLFGLIRPAIYVPAETAADRRLLRHALAHEYSHFKQLDHVWGVLRAVCLALHWYNPLVWLAARLSRRDCELACDEAAIRLLGESDRADYGRSLIKLTCEKARGSAVATTMCAGPRELKERIKMLTHKRHSVIALVLAALLTLTATACSFTGGGSSPAPVGGSDSAALSYNEEGGYYEFTAPEGTEYVHVRGWAYTGGEWALADSGGWNCFERMGRLSLIEDREEGSVVYCLEFDEPEGTRGVSGTFDFARGVEADSWSVARNINASSPALEVETVLLMFDDVYEGEASSVSESYFDNPELITDKDSYYYCVTVMFSANPPETASLDPRAYAEYGKMTFDYTAPESAEGMAVSAYEFNGTGWTLFDRTVYPLDEKSGTLDFAADIEAQLVEFSLNGGESKTAAYDLPDLAAAYLMGAMEANLNFEIPALLLYSGSSCSGPSAYYNVEELDEGGSYVCFTVTFTSGGQYPQAEESPRPTAAPQSADIVGFSVETASESYEDILNDWVHAYAENLVRLTASDPAACSSVQIQNFELVAASLTEPERIIARMSLDCYARDISAFEMYYGIVQPVEYGVNEDEIFLQLNRVFILELADGDVKCISSSTDMPDQWGYQSFEPQGDPDYIVKMAGAGMSAERIVQLVNYSELNEASAESWMALLEALDDIAISPEGADDQLIRDMYAMLAVEHADGAYATWLGNIYIAQREHDPEAFEAALSAFDSETREHVIYLADHPI